MSFTFLNDWKQIESRIMFHDMWEIYEIQFSGFINTVWLEWNHTHPSAYCPLRLFLNKAESGGYDRAHMAHRLGISAPSLSTETVCWLLLWYLTYVSGERKLGMTLASVKVQGDQIFKKAQRFFFYLFLFFAVIYFNSHKNFF